MNPRIDITGQRSGRLVVLRFSRRFGRRAWLCRCDCGTEKIIQNNNLSRNTNSCGCLKKEMIGQRRFAHGMPYSPEHNIWRKMICRCCAPHSDD
jgi:hypothetical protein